jgi:hypothetical protein
MTVPCHTYRFISSSTTALKSRKAFHPCLDKLGETRYKRLVVAGIGQDLLKE